MRYSVSLLTSAPPEPKPEDPSQPTNGYGRVVVTRDVDSLEEKIVFPPFTSDAVIDCVSVTDADGTVRIIDL